MIPIHIKCFVREKKERYKLRKHRKNDLDGFRKMQQFRSDFERARLMLKLVRRRERCKRVFVDVLDELRKQTLYELTDRSGVPRNPKVPTATVVVCVFERNSGLILVVVAESCQRRTIENHGTRRIRSRN